MCASKAFFPCILNVILSSFTWPHVVPHYTLFCLFNEGNCSFDSRWTKKILFWFESFFKISNFVFHWKNMSSLCLLLPSDIDECQIQGVCPNGNCINAIGKLQMYLQPRLCAWSLLTTLLSVSLFSSLLFSSLLFSSLLFSSLLFSSLLFSSLLFSSLHLLFSSLLFSNASVTWMADVFGMSMLSPCLPTQRYLLM